jgi:peptidylprolyl isomerase
VNTGGNTTTLGQKTPAQTAQDTAMTGDSLSVYYTGMFANGTVFDTNKNDKPLTFTLGNSSIIKGFQDAVTGMAVNEEKTVTIPYGQAYGPYRPELVRVVPRIGPIANKTFTNGQFFAITRKSDQAVSVVRILNVTPDMVTWDENNPLAGQNLTYVIKLVSINKK